MDKNFWDNPAADAEWSNLQESLRIINDNERMWEEENNS